MNSEDELMPPTRLQLVLHKQRQKKAIELLRTLCGSEVVFALPEADSIALEQRILQEAKTARQSGTMRLARCSNASELLIVLNERQLWSAHVHGATEIFLRDGAGTGFVEGIVSPGCLQKLLENGVDGVAIVDTTNSRAVLVDVVVDDTVDGSFVEVEEWTRTARGT